MSLHLEIIGEKTDFIPFKYDEDIVILYALSVGSGVNELDFVYEKKLKVFPTFAVIPILPCIEPLMMKTGIHLPTVLHGEQKIILHEIIPVEGTLYTTGEWKSVYDKGDNGAILNFSLQTYDKDKRLLFENEIVVVDRSAGNFGGDRGPITKRLEPPEGEKPEFHVTYSIPHNQAAIYRLCGDKNPLHIDPEFAKSGGLERPILHGLCTYGYAGRAIVHSVCGGDPSRLRSFAARFLNVVFPGDTIVVEGWKQKEGKYVIQVKANDGRIVLGNSIAELSS